MSDSEDDSAESLPTFRRFAIGVLASLILAAALLAVWIVQDRHRTLAEWGSRLDSFAAEQRRILELWLGERTADARVWSAFPTVQLLASRGAVAPSGDSSAASDSRTHLEAILSTAAKAYGYSGIRILDAAGGTLAQSAGAEPLFAPCREIVRQAIRDERPAFVFHLHDGEVRLALATPIPTVSSRREAALLAEIDPRKELYPLLALHPLPAATGESFLLRRSGMGVAFLSPLRHPDSAALLAAREVRPDRLERTALEMTETSGRFLDARGMEVLASARAVRGTDWVLVVKLDRSEALASHRRAVTATSLGLMTIIASLFGAGVLLRRSEAARAAAQSRLLEERHRSASEHAQAATAHRRAGEMRLLEMIATGGPLEETLTALATFVEDQHEGVLASVLLIEDGKVWHVAAPSLPEDYRRALDGVEIGESQGFCGAAAFLGETVVVTDIATDPLWAGFREVALRHGLAACWSVPIRTADGNVRGTIALYRREPAGPSPEELRIVERATSVAAIAIDRRRSEQELERSLAELRAVFEGSTIGLALVDPAGRPIKVNPALERFLGYSAAELSGLAFPEFTHPDDRDVDLALYRELARGERRSYQLEKRYLRKDGQVVWGRLTVSLVHGTDGAPRFAIAMVEDFTERRRLQQEVQQASKMEAIGRLAGGIAHDFNNILSVILGYGELMLAEVGDGQPLRPQLEEILTAAHRAALLTKQLLAFSRKQTLETKVLDPRVVVSELAQLLRRVVGEDLEFEVKATPDAGRVRADRGQLEQVLMNLVVNARDAMPEGGRLTLETSDVTLDEKFAAVHPGSSAGSFVRIQVSDTGVGMSKEVLTHAFEPFFTTKEAGQGTGLGLSTVYGIVKQSGGYIAVESAPGRGTRFDIYLPRVDDPVSQVPAPAETPLRGNESILVVEDETSLRTLLLTMLSSYGYRVRIAPGALAALELCATELAEARIDLLLTDIVMPDMNGLELARRIREIRPGVHVLYMSGYTEDVLVRRGELEEGAFMIAKPFRGDALARKVREALDYSS